MAEKMLELQQQMRNNSEELQDFLRDLGNWTKQMEIKDEQLKKKKGDSKNKNSAQAPRSVDELKRKIPNVDNRKEEKKTKIVEPVKTDQRIPSYDYDAWSKFDVDKALEEVEEKKDNSEPQAAEMDPEMRFQRAVVEKDKGNQCFKVSLTL